MASEMIVAQIFLTKPISHPKQAHGHSIEPLKPFTAIDEPAHHK